jgi:hypothetical protein
MTAGSLGDVVDDARRRGFVGRRSELSAFDAALAGGGACRVLFVHGPGGIGKTTLLLEMQARALVAGRSVALLDGPEVDPSPAGVRAALDPAVAVVLVDGYEHLAAVDGWVRRELVPSLAAEAVVVLAGREPPAAPWRADPGWRRVVAVHQLTYLDHVEGADLLDRAGVDEAVRDRLLELGRGHPLALALLADVAATGTVPERLADVPDLIAALMESQLREAPSDAHLAGLGTCAKAWLTTEDLLRKTVGPGAAEVYAWLRQRPFVASRPRGLTPHDLTRDVIEAELERRSPDRYRTLHRIIHDHVVDGVRTATGFDRQLFAQELLYLHRRSPLVAVTNRLRARGSAAVVPARADEHGRLVSMIERWEGPDSAALLDGWLADEPDGISVVRGDDGVAGFIYHVLSPSGSAMEHRDPVVRAVLDHIARTAPTRPGETVDIARFMCGDQEHQRSEHAVLTASVSSIMLWCTLPLAWSFIPIVDADFWGPYFDYLGFRPLFDVTAVGQRHVVYGHDWRRFPPDAWLEMMNDREHNGGTGPPPASLLRPAPLDRAGFGSAVRAALQQLNRADRLDGNPLVGGRLGASADEVRATVVAAVDRLADEPKGDRLRAVLDRTFIRAAPTQEAAAEVLGLPFSTYRRHLTRAVDHVTEVLWSVEIGQRMSTDRPGD